MPRTEQAPFNNPFADPRTARRLRREVQAARPHARAPLVRPAARSTGHVAAEPACAARPDSTPGDDVLWTAAVQGAVPLQDRRAQGRGGAEARILPGFVHPDREAEEALRRFVEGHGVLDVHDTDEAVQSPPGMADPVLLRRLQQGAFSVQRHVDLHGLRVDEARDEMRVFLRDAQRDNLRCVLVVHGRGLHSKDRNPVLKERVVAWLSRGAMSRAVLAFATARPHDGGAGALYVLLRTPRGGGPAVP